MNTALFAKLTKEDVGGDSTAVPVVESPIDRWHTTSRCIGDRKHNTSKGDKGPMAGKELCRD
jgi:hypothetical protein